MSKEVDLGAALARALRIGPGHFVIDYAEPKTRSEAETLERAGATSWRADRDMLKRCWRPVTQGARCAPHPIGERCDVPPSALLASARLP